MAVIASGGAAGAPAPLPPPAPAPAAPAPAAPATAEVPPAAAPTAPPAPAAPPAAAAAPTAQIAPPPAGEEVVPVNHIRKAIGQHMVASVQTSARAWTMVEVNVDHLVKLRERAKDAFKDKYGVSLTYLPFVIRATCDALSRTRRSTRSSAARRSCCTGSCTWASRSRTTRDSSCP